MSLGFNFLLYALIGFLVSALFSSRRDRSHRRRSRRKRKEDKRKRQSKPSYYDEDDEDDWVFADELYEW